MAQSRKFTGDLDEFDLIRRWTRTQFKRGGVGEDAALGPVAPGALPVLTTDLLIEGAHFDRRWMRPQEIGWRLLARGLSDLAGVGARPRYFLVSAALPRTTPLRFMDGVYAGFYHLAKKIGVRLIGGDTSHTRGPIVFDIVAVGEVSARDYVSRRGARVGDRIFLTGSVGDASLALKKFRKGWTRRRLQGEWPEAFRRFLHPQPKIEVGRWAAQHGATAMIDISDGLLADLGHILKASGVGARLEWGKIPRPKGSGLEALTGGDDYELLATFPKSASLPRGFRRIGTITGRRGRITLIDDNGKSLSLPAQRGYRHFNG